jgi:hypothetical protein
MEALAASVIALVTPYLVKGGEAFAGEVGKATFKKVSDLVQRLETWWSRDPVAHAAATAIPTNPALNGKRLGGMLDDALEGDPAFASDLRRLVDGLGPEINVIQEMKVANGVTGADIGRLVIGRVSITQKVDEATSVTGFKADEVGR